MKGRIQKLYLAGTRIEMRAIKRTFMVRNIGQHPEKSRYNAFFQEQCDCRS